MVAPNDFVAGTNMAKTPWTRSQLAAELRKLGVQPGDILEVHAGLRSVGEVVVGADAIVVALLDAVGPKGTLVVVATWDSPISEMAEWTPDVQALYRAEAPAFDPARSPITRDNGWIAERIRTWPGALRGHHPEMGVVALGARAQWVIEPQPDDLAFGVGTPYDRIKNASGKVLMLGAPLETITMLHHAETLATAPGKRFVRYEIPHTVKGERVWKAYREIESTVGAYDYAPFVPKGVDAFEVIAGDALSAGIGVAGTVGSAKSHLFPALKLVEFTLGWIDARLGPIATVAKQRKTARTAKI